MEDVLIVVVVSWESWLIDIEIIYFVKFKIVIIWYCLEKFC